MKKLSRTLKFSLAFILLTVLITAAFYIVDAILDSKGLMLREKTSNAVFTGIVVCTFAFFVFLFIFLVQNVVKKTLTISKRIINGVCAFLVFLLTFSSSIFVFISFAFSSQPEHEVTRDGKLMVACVNSYLQVEVNYHKYVNSLVMGKKVVYWEDYGNGGYDPFTVNPMPEVKRSGKLSPN